MATSLLQPTQHCGHFLHPQKCPYIVVKKTLIMLPPINMANDHISQSKTAGPQYCIKQLSQ